MFFCKLQQIPGEMRQHEFIFPGLGHGQRFQVQEADLFCCPWVAHSGHSFDFLSPASPPHGDNIPTDMCGENALKRVSASPYLTSIVIYIELSHAHGRHPDPRLLCMEPSNLWTELALPRGQCKMASSKFNHTKGTDSTATKPQSTKEVH